MKINNECTKIIIISILMLVIDIMWIYLYMGNKYKILIEHIQKSEMRPRFIFAIFAIYVNVTWFVYICITKFK